MSMHSLLKPDAGWHLTLYPDAGEAGGSFRSSSRPRVVRISRPGESDNPERSRASAAARARGKVRRYAAANRLDRFGTLTYALGTADPQQVRVDVADFIRRLRAARGGSAFPYVWVPERHKSGNFHLHFALDAYVRRTIIDEAWGRGFVSIKRVGNVRIGASRWESSRIAARYMAKYIGKTFEADAEPGLHRYEVGQGFQPRIVRESGDSAEDLLEWASDQMGAYPAIVWTSQREPGWQGPPSRWAQWA